VIRSGASTQEVIESYAGSLYGLWLTGVARVIDPESGQVITEVAGSGSRPQRMETDPEAAALREELVEMEQKDHYELLGVAESADAKAVRSAFMGLAKSHHPDRHSTKSESVRQVASEIFALLSAASETLSDPSSAEEYLRKLRRGSSEEDERKVVERILTAEQNFTRGEAMFGKRAYKQALEYFRQALDTSDDEADFHAYFGWTHYLVHHQDGGAAELAREHIERALQLAPESATGYYFLGRLHKACNQPQLALKMFRTVLEIQPEHVEASRELRLMQIRKEKDKSGGGLFGIGKKRK
jgi:curved DNA-binding protein CbpA